MAISVARVSPANTNFTEVKVNKNKIALLVILSVFLFSGFICAQENIDELFNKGIAFGQEKKYDEAVAVFNKIISLSPKNAEAYCYRGFAYEGKGSIDKAIEDFSKAIKIDPKFSLPYEMRAFVYFADKKDYGKAWEDVHKAESLGGTLSPQFIEELKRVSGRSS